MNPTPKRAGVGRIPPEILSEIFLHCLPPDSASQNTQQVLSSVCRLWHTLALATPALWASLDIACGVDVLRPPLPVIRTHLQRSQTHPLSFILRTADPERLLADRPLVLTALTALAAARQRWHSIHIRLDWITQDILDLITEGDAPLLQSIRCGPCGLRGLPIPLRMLDRCPRLESFQWGPRRSFGSSLLLPLSDTKLTSLSLEMISAQECIALLRLSPRLSSARFHVFNFPGPSATPRLTHPTLHTLTIVGTPFTTLLAALTLPALLDLNLTTEHDSDLPPQWAIELSAFFERSKPMLRQLSISTTEMLEPGLLRILALTPHLRSLTLGGFFTAKLIHALHPSPPLDAPLCPCLQNLRVAFICNCPDGLYGAMLRARWGTEAHTYGVACLKCAHVEFMDNSHDRDKADMTALHAEGMQGFIS